MGSCSPVVSLWQTGSFCGYVVMFHRERVMGEIQRRSMKMINSDEVDTMLMS
jgi:hypothetical protein